jgi:hypothetical protein
MSMFWVYSENMMKKEVIQFKVDKPKSRAHYVLYGDTPFRPKKVESKLLYKRKAKHPKQDY